MAQSFLRGAMIITIASLLSKIIGSVFRIPLQNIAGNEVFGIFSIVYPIYMAVLILSVAGIPLAISKLISEARAHDRTDDIRSIFLTASILATLFGVLSFTVMVVISSPLADMLGGEYMTLSIIVVSATLLVAPYMAVYRGFFQGYETMTPTAVSQVAEQLIRVFVILLIAFIMVEQGFSPAETAGGVMVGSIVGAFASLLYLRWTFVRSEWRPVHAASYRRRDFMYWSKRILSLSAPILIGALAMALVNFIDSMTVPAQLNRIGFESLEVANAYGYYGRGLAMVQIAVVFAQALILPLVPAITKAMAEGDSSRTVSLTEKSMTFTHFVAWPAAAGLFALTVPINFSMFGDFQENTLLAVVHASALLTALAVLTTGVLQGMNRLKISAGIVAAASLLKIVLNIVLIEAMGLVGVAWSTVLVYLFITVLNLIAMRRTVPFRTVQRSHAVFAVSALIMAAVVSLPQLWVDLCAFSRGAMTLYLIGMIVLGMVVYVALVTGLKAFTREEIKSLPVIGKFVS